jgi:6-phosphogluconolactonase (cycloisomerase 2 family)
LLDTRTDGTITAFAINATTGALTPVSGSPFVINVAPGVLLIEPKGRFAYAPSFDSGAVAAFALDATTGAPTALTGSPFAACAEYSAPAAVIDPAGTHLYVGGSGPVPAGDPLDGLICAYTIDASSGALTPVAGSPFHASNDPGNALAIDPSGKFLFLAGTGGLAEFLVNADGTLTAVAGSPFAAGENPELLALDPAGPFIYVGNQSTGSYAQIFGFSIDATTGSLTPVPGSPYANGDVPLSLTFDPSGSRIYVGNQSSNTFTTYTVDPQTGALSAAGAPAATGAGSIVLVQ